MAAVDAQQDTKVADKVAEGLTAPDVTQLGPERLKEMRRALHEHLSRTNTYDQLREIIATHAAEHIDFNPNNPDDVMTLVKERGIVQEVLGRMNAPQTSQRIGQGSRRSLRGLKPGQRYLHLRLLGGRAFLDNIDSDPKVLKQQQMVVSVHFDRQRLRSSPVDCNCDPQFDDDFLLELNPKGVEELVDMNSPLHIIASKEDTSFYRSRVVGENTVDWRKVLKSGFLSMSVELAGENAGVPAGIVELQLELIPGGRRYAEEEIANTAQHQRSQTTAMDREFLIYARRWWSDFHAIRPSHADRKVKVFAANSTGRLVPVTHFVSPMQPDRVLETPFDAARFVSLLAVDGTGDAAQEVLAGAKGGSETWNSLLGFLVQRRGDSPNHATLLCSLLLGFGIDAYCVIGTDRSARTRMWVATRTRGSAPYSYDVTFWEPTTAQRFHQTAEHPYATVGCAFNHTQFYANIQESDNAVTCDFDLEEERKWQSMNPIKLKIVTKARPAPLLWIPLDTRSMEADMEQSLGAAITDHRQTMGLHTNWDEGVSYVLAQALAAYERQRVTLERPDMTQFNQCVKGTIGEGRTFKGFPLNVTHTNVKKIIAAVAAHPTGRDLLELSADEAHHSIRVRITPFPEGVFSLWIMVSAWYRSLP